MDCYPVATPGRSLESLPTELWINILTFLSSYRIALGAFSLTSRFGREIAQPILFRAVEVFEDPTAPSDDDSFATFLQFLPSTQITRHIRSLTLYGRLLPDCGLDLDVLCGIIDAAPGIESLTIKTRALSSKHVFAPTPTLRRLVNLKNLALSFEDSTRASGTCLLSILCHITSLFGKIEELQIYDMPIRNTARCDCASLGIRSSSHRVSPATVISSLDIRSIHDAFETVVIYLFATTTPLAKTLQSITISGDSDVQVLFMVKMIEAWDIPGPLCCSIWVSDSNAVQDACKHAPPYNVPLVIV